MKQASKLVFTVAVAVAAERVFEHTSKVSERDPSAKIYGAEGVVYSKNTVMQPTQGTAAKR